MFSRNEFHQTRLRGTLLSFSRFGGSVLRLKTPWIIIRYFCLLIDFKWYPIIPMVCLHRRATTRQREISTFLTRTIGLGQPSARSLTPQLRLIRYHHPRTLYNNDYGVMVKWLGRLLAKQEDLGSNLPSVFSSFSQQKDLGLNYGIDKNG